MSNKTKLGTELKGIARLIKDGSLGLTDVMESMHQRVIYPPFLPTTPIQDMASSISTFAYYSIRQSTKIIGEGVEKLLDQLTPVLGETKTISEAEALRSTLNGLIGDYLEAENNALQITMHFRFQSQNLVLKPDNLKEAIPNINGKILVLVHGSCLNDSSWSRKDHNHGESIARELDKTLIYLNYNSGCHVSKNGQKFNDLLEQLVLNWPVKVEEITMFSHSMGGLVARSAMYYGAQNKNNWFKKLKKTIFLGTPHHGSIVERTGNYFDVIFDKIHYTKPLARLGKMRSEGVTDLRYGNITDQDWKGNNRFEINGDQRIHVSLPKNVDSYTVAATTGKASTPLTLHLLGDGLVDIKSAFGQHKNQDKDLNFKEENTWVAYETTHMDLLSEPLVYEKIKSWMEEPNCEW
jgi:pimeloyl-ACP methyl ester carboxylesterase